MDVAIVRAALTGVAEIAGWDPELVADLKTAVSEACNNAVLHAYDGSPGPMVVCIEVRHAGIEVTVTDRGRGLTRIAPGSDRMGLGLAIISALADQSEFSSPDGGGTEVRMRFDRDTGVPEGDPEDPGDLPQGCEEKLSGDIVAWFTPIELARFLLGRVFRSVAASSPFSVARYQELATVNDAISSYAELAADGWIGVAVSSSAKGLSVTGGPFVVPVPGAQDGSVVTDSRAHELELRRAELARVVDRLSSERFDDHELLHLKLARTDDRR